MSDKLNEFINSRREHKLLRLEYYDFQKLCTVIIADYSVQEICVENYTDDWIITAIGNRRKPTWEDYQEFLEDRCIPRTRAGLRYYLDAIGVDEFDPLAIIRKTEGRMAEDHQWIRLMEL